MTLSLRESPIPTPSTAFSLRSSWVDSFVVTSNEAAAIVPREQEEIFDITEDDGGILRELFKKHRRIRATGEKYYGFEYRSDWEFYNPTMDSVGFDVGETQRFFNEIYENDQWSHQKRRWLCTNYLNCCFSQASVPKKENSTWNRFRYDERRNRMILEPIGPGIMRELTSGLVYPEETVKKRWNKEQKQWEDETTYPMKPFLKYYLGSLHRKRFICYVFWPEENPGWLIKKRKTRRDKGRSLQMDLQQLALLSDEEMEKHALLDDTEVLFFNEWRGFQYYTPHGIQKLPDFEIRDASLVLGRILDLLLEVVCNGDSQCFEYMKRWHAFIRQNPDLKTEVVPVLMGQQGSGKTFWVKHVFVGSFGGHGHMFAKWQVCFCFV